MGVVIPLAEHRGRRSTGARAAAAPSRRQGAVVFAFDLGDPETYLAAERVERMFGTVRWRPVLRAAIGLPAPAPALVQERAAALRMPLVWPQFAGSWHTVVRPAARVATLAAERGRAAPFVLAAGRLAVCGGFALDRPEVLAEAAAAADLGLDDALRAARDPARDAMLRAATRTLADQGVHRLPALRVGRSLFCGEQRLDDALAAARGTALGARTG